MKAYKCDICGNLYEKNLTLTVEDGKRKKECFLVTDFTSRVDICPDCVEAIQRVIDERKDLFL